MAAREIITLNETASRLEVPQTGDTYNLPRSASVAGDVTATGNISTTQVHGGGKVAPATGRI